MTQGSDGTVLAGDIPTAEFLPPGYDTNPFDDVTVPSADDNPSPPPPPAPPKAGPPSLAEWQHFFANVLIKTATNKYVDWAFRDVDENDLSERDMQRIYMTEDERERIAKPFSELANKSKYTRKHGRAIIALSGSLDSIIALGMWMERVNKIAKRHQSYKSKVVKAEQRDVNDVGTGPYAANGTNGRVPPGFQYGWAEPTGTG